MNTFRCVIIHIIWYFIHFTWIQAEPQSSYYSISLEEMLISETVVIEELYNFITQWEIKLEFLRNEVTRYAEENEHASKNFDEHLSDPVNVYLLVKRLTYDWKKLENFLNNDLDKERLIKSIGNSKLPTYEDLHIATMALLLLQIDHNLSAETVVDGWESGDIQFKRELRSDDCFELGRQSYINEDYYHSTLWLQEALKKRGADMNRISETSISRIFLPPQYFTANSQEGITIHDMLCKNMIELPPELSSQLKCRYVDKNNPYLLIAPLKEEEAFLNPRILIYHDVVHPQEMEKLKEVALPHLEPAEVFNQETNTIAEDKKYRVADSVFLDDSIDPVVSTIRRRVKDITSLSIDTAESLHVIRYSPGGFYVPHYDYFNTYMEEGDRIATVLFYLNDVAYAGATVFTKLNVTVQPQKGSAIFWFNLKSSGSSDTRTVHAGCTVYEGYKWISTLWLHEAGQEFLRPCDPVDAP